MTRLTWPDLLIQDMPLEQFHDWLEPWEGVVTGRVSPVFLNNFGFSFFLRPEDHIEMLNVYSGTIERVADNYDSFLAEVNQQWWQEAYLFSELVFQLHDAGKIPGEGECYLICPHPAIGGPNPASRKAIDPKYVTVGDVAVWMSICAQFAA